MLYFWLLPVGSLFQCSPAFPFVFSFSVSTSGSLHVSFPFSTFLLCCSSPLDFLHLWFSQHPLKAPPACCPTFGSSHQWNTLTEVLARWLRRFRQCPLGTPLMDLIICLSSQYSHPLHCDCPAVCRWEMRQDVNFFFQLFWTSSCGDHQSKSNNVLLLTGN